MSVYVQRSGRLATNIDPTESLAAALITVAFKIEIAFDDHLSGRGLKTDLAATPVGVRAGFLKLFYQCQKQHGEN